MYDNMGSYEIIVYDKEGMIWVCRSTIYIIKWGIGLNFLQSHSYDIKKDLEGGSTNDADGVTTTHARPSFLG